MNVFDQAIENTAGFLHILSFMAFIIVYCLMTFGMIFSGLKEFFEKGNKIGIAVFFVGLVALPTGVFLTNLWYYAAGWGS